MKKCLKALLFPVLIAACAPPVSGSSTEERGPFSPTAPESTLAIATSAQPQEIVTATLSSRDTPLESTPWAPTTQKVAYPEVVKACPDEREVSLEEIGLNPSTRLIVASFDRVSGLPIKDGLFMISGDDPEPRQIPGTIPNEGWLVGNFGLSPDDEWLLFQRWMEGTQERHVWISSLDGERQWELATISLKEWAYWVSEKEVLIEGIPEGRALSHDAMNPLYSIDPFTGEMRSFPPLPEEAVFLDYFGVDGTSYALYYVGFQTYEELALHDYSSGTSTPILPWLVGKDWVNFHTGGPGVGLDGLLDITVNRPYGFDFAKNLDLDSIREPKSYQEVMTAVMLPEGPPDFAEWSLGEELSIVERTAHEDEEAPTWFYVLDYDKMILKDYCLDVEFMSNPEDISVDGRFVAITYLEGPLGSHPLYAKWVLILDLETGRFARIHKTQAIGWGEVRVP